ncbi:MAG: hypothetical protein LBH59_07785 [Planctomycetaceae bacterium]|nr:hypothetical protein [Planctomycetaceae bacterium]
MKTFLNLISFKDNYLIAIFFYLGASLLILGITPNSSSLHAQNGCGGEAVCPAGYTCCNGECCSGTTCPCCNPQNSQQQDQ